MLQFAGDVVDSQLLPDADLRIAAPADQNGDGLPRSRVDEMRQHDSGENLQAGAVGLDPHARREFRADQRRGHRMGEVDVRAVVARHAKLLGALSGVRAATGPPLHFEPIFQIGAGSPPSRFRPFESFMPGTIGRRSPSGGGNHNAGQYKQRGESPWAAKNRSGLHARPDPVVEKSKLPADLDRLVKSSGVSARKRLRISSPFVPPRFSPRKGSGVDFAG